jgi:hypothetical protein
MNIFQPIQNELFLMIFPFAGLRVETPVIRNLDRRCSCAYVQRCNMKMAEDEPTGGKSI